MTQKNIDTENACCVHLIEDDEFLRHSLKQALEIAGFKVHAFENAKLALEQFAVAQPDVVLSDLYLGQMNEMTGLDVLVAVRTIDAELPVILMTARGDIQTAIDAIRKGAYDFLEKPFERDHLLIILQRAVEQRRLIVENRTLRDRLGFASGMERILRGQSAEMVALRNIILKIAPAPANVIILGETGAGKEMVARCLHEFSGRQGHFVAINCAAIPEELFESELFGHEAGAYTGAAKQRVGKIEYADGGTLFLDEIEAMPLHLQAKILRVLQERQVERLGSNKLITVDLRIVAATKVDLKEYSAQGKFRLDLFFRLNVATVKIPPLRERREDILMLFSQFIQESALRFRQPVATVSREIQQKLLTYDWPGNVRELRNAAEQLQLDIPMSFETGDAGSATASPSSLEEIVASIEKVIIADTLRRHEGVATTACAELKINYSTLYRKMKTYGMDLSQYRGPGEVSQ